MEKDIRGDLKDSFAHIDRNKENNDVTYYQKSRDPELLSRLYEQRVPTLKVWARKYYYLFDSYEDTFQELSGIFLKIVNGYTQRRIVYNESNEKQIRTTPFNTFLMYSIHNYIKNVIGGKKAKKRTPDGCDKENYFLVCPNPLSLDFPYKNSKNGTLKTLKDDLEDNNISNSFDNLCYSDGIEIISNYNKDVSDILKMVGHGHTINEAVKEAKKTFDSINVSEEQLDEILKHRKIGRNKAIHNLIEENKNYESNFKVIDFLINGRKIDYIIEMKKTQATTKFMKVIRKLRKNKFKEKDKLIQLF